MTTDSSPCPITAPTGTALSCKGWHQEAALRMLMNNLDPAVAERPEELIVYGGGGKAARNWECYERIVATLRRLENDETLLVQSGKPVGVFRTHDEAPRVLIANAHLVPRWATWDEFRRLDALGPDDVRPDDRRLVDLHRHAGHPAGNVRDVRRMRPPALRRHARGAAGRDRRSRRDGRRPAARRHDERRGVPGRGRRRVADPPAGRDTGYCDRIEHDLDAALPTASTRRGPGARPLSVGLVGNIAEVLPELVRRGVVPDVVTDQTSAHDLRVGYIPAG